MEAKPWYLSKTIWTNIILAGLITIIPALKDALNAENVALGFGVINLVLRFVTKSKLEIS